MQAHSCPNQDGEPRWLPLTSHHENPRRALVGIVENERFLLVICRGNRFVSGMARQYEVLIHGSGFRVQMEDGSIAHRFYARRRFSSPSTPQAAVKAVAIMRAELAADPRFQGDAQPVGSAMTVEECYRLGWVSRLLTRASKDIVFRREDS